VANHFHATVEVDSRITDFVVVFWGTSAHGGREQRRSAASQDQVGNFSIKGGRGRYTLEARMGSHVETCHFEVRDDRGRSWTLGPLQPFEAGRSFTLT
jgi:hypothetical protein